MTAIVRNREQTVQQGKKSGIRIEKLTEHIGASITDVDLSRTISEEELADIHKAWVDNGVLVFRGQDLPPAMHVEFSARFGPLIGHVVNRFNLQDFPEVTLISNVANEKGEKIGADRAGMIWHSDMSFMQRPSMGSLLYGVECPPTGADTEFASMFAAYDALPAAMRVRLEGLKGIHDYAWHYETYLTHRPPLTDAEKAKTPPVEHPAIRTHPVTKRKAMYVGEGLTRTFAGMDEAEGRALVIEISDFSTQPQFVYRHKWEVGDLVFWDNRSTMHRATEFDDRYRRLMRRTTILGDVPF
jgi:taurine dioxygenase